MYERLLDPEYAREMALRFRETKENDDHAE
jgi:hypothetical protein